jgi:hypothetical protein
MNQQFALLLNMAVQFENQDLLSNRVIEVNLNSGVH